MRWSIIGIMLGVLFCSSVEAKKKKPALVPYSLTVKTPEIQFVGTLWFVKDSDRLQKESHAALDQLAALLLKNTALSFFLVVHADGRDDELDKYSRYVTQVKADEIRKYLIRAGVSPENIEAKGFQGGCPISAGKAPEERAKNYRVELITKPADGSYVSLCPPASAPTTQTSK
jgi:outer membrane protein OmpA-like peptidoglycan-associated protein